MVLHTYKNFGRKKPLVFVMPYATIADERMRTSTVDVILPNAKNVCLFSTPFSPSADILGVLWVAVAVVAVVVATVCSTIALEIHATEWYTRIHSV